jgi:hypothetical protein
MKVFIHSVPNADSAYKVDQLRDPQTNKPLHRSKYNDDCKTVIQALYSGKVGGLKNGLSYKPWLDENGIQKVDEAGKKLTLQDKKEQQ